jgi:hypothetical protein
MDLTLDRSELYRGCDGSSVRAIEVPLGAVGSGAAQRAQGAERSRGRGSEEKGGARDGPSPGLGLARFPASVEWPFQRRGWPRGLAAGAGSVGATAKSLEY